MPTYEYECTQCSHVFEKFQSMTEAPEKKCPKCHGAVKRLIGAGAGILFKGSGFYGTDHRSSEYRKKAKENSPAPASSGESCGKCGSSNPCGS